MFDFKSFYDYLAEALPSPCRFVEVGVADGASALYMAEKLHSLGKEFEMYWIDNLAYGGNKQLQEIVKNLVRSGLGHKITFIPCSSLDAAASFNDEFFHAAFLDSSHEYKQTKAEIILWHRKIMENGHLCGHDYHLYEDVKSAVLELLPQKRCYLDDKEFYESLTIHETEKKYGVWEFRKNYQAPLNIR
jgi:cephalosporin hydroxylase